MGRTIFPALNMAQENPLKMSSFHEKKSIFDILKERGMTEEEIWSRFKLTEKEREEFRLKWVALGLFPNDTSSPKKSQSDV